MALMRFILIVAVGYLLWRIARLVLRMLQNPSRENDGVVQPPDRTQSPSQTFKDVKDAKYQDLPPTEKQDDKAGS